MKVVDLLNVTKKYGKRTILNNISFSVEDGEMVSIIGTSGCGKSTILNIIGLLETHDSGVLNIMNHPVPKIESARATILRRNEINYLFQSYALISDITVNKNLLLAMHFLDVPPKEKQERIDEILSLVGMHNMKNAMVNTLSGGEQQRVALSRTIIKPGRLILADEPTGSLDDKSEDTAFFLLKDLCTKYKKTALIVTHNLKLASQTDRIINLVEINAL